MIIKPFDLDDLRHQLATSLDSIAELNNDKWVAQIRPEEWDEILRRATQGLKKQIAKCSRAPASVLEKLAEDSDMYVERAVAQNPNTPASVLAELARDSERDVREAVAQNPSTPASVLAELARDSDYSVRKAVAWNPSTPASVLEELARDSVSVVRKTVAKHPNPPASVLEMLARDSDDGVRQTVAGRKNPPASVLEKLARDSVDSVRQTVAQNPNTPASVLEKLAKDSVKSVREAVAQNPSTKNPNKPAKAGCFIATAATGSYEHPMVRELRIFRDQVLEASNLGRKVIAVYYRKGPAWADAIARSRMLRPLVKWAIVAPLALLARVFNRKSLRCSPPSKK